MYWDNSRIDKINRILRNDPIFVSIFEETVVFLEYFYNSYNHPYGVAEKKSQLLATLRELKKITDFSFSCLTRYIMTTPPKLLDYEAIDSYMIELALSMVEDDGRSLDALHSESEFVVHDISRKILVCNRYDYATFEYFQPDADLWNSGESIPVFDLENISKIEQDNASSPPYNTEELVQKADAKYQQVRKEERAKQKLEKKMLRAERKMQNRLKAQAENKKKRNSVYARGKAMAERIERKKKVESMFEARTRTEEDLVTHGKLTVSFPNGRSICYSNAQETFHEVIRGIAPQLIGTSIEWRGIPIVTYAIGMKHKHQYTTEGYYIMTPVSIANMCKILQVVSQELLLGWEVTT